NGIADSTIKAAQNSPTYKFVKEWGMALPLHPEFRTMPMLFYVPPLLPVMASLASNDVASQKDTLNPISKFWERATKYDASMDNIFGTVDDARMPLKYLANLFSNGDEELMKITLKKLMAVRLHRRDVTVGDLNKEMVAKSLEEVGLDPEMAEAVYYLTSLAKFDDRFVIPAAHREQAIEMAEFTGDRKGRAGFGFTESPARGL
ncbi:MAG: nitrate reductase subunit beta, partial [Maribacter sp.]|nr:nitrate reductase subunit beta [Maribacter sp.]